MPVGTTIRSLDYETAQAVIDGGGVYIDMRPVTSYLEVHIPGSIELLYEAGPGFAARARDCLPLDLHLVLLEDERVDSSAAAAALRGKGFDVVGSLADGINEWARAHGTPASTDILEQLPDGVRLLHVGDPGAVAPQDATVIPIERLAARISELGDPGRIVVIAGVGVRAALGIGILERHGFEPAFLKSP